MQKEIAMAVIFPLLCGERRGMVVAEKKRTGTSPALQTTIHLITFIVTTFPSESMERMMFIPFTGVPTRVPLTVYMSCVT